MSQANQRRQEQRQRDRSALLITLVISLLAHLALLPPLLDLWRQQARPAPERTGVQVVKISHSNWLRNRSVRASEASAPQPRPERPAEPPRDDDEPLTPPGQVVALPPPEREQRPDQARYASEFDRQVDQESRSRHQTPDFLNPAHRPQVGNPERREVPSASEAQAPAVVLRAEQPGGPEGRGREQDGQGPTPEGKGGGRPQAELSLPRIEQRDALALKTDPAQGEMKNRSYSEELLGRDQRLALRLGPLKSQVESLQQTPGPTGQRGGSGREGQGFAALTPDLRTLERLSGAPANDHLPDVEEDDATFLNTWRWKHAPFFNRVAEGIRREWRPGPEIARRDPTGNIYGFQDRFTLLRVTIDREGAIREVVISESCGVDFLDREAVAAFRRAQPFSNPPSRLFASADTYTFQFGFNVDFQTSPLIQFNWRAAP